MKHALPAAARLFLPALACLASGCARETTGYPSLLPRAIESRSDAEPVVMAAIAAPDPALDAKIATLLKAQSVSNAALAPVSARAERAAQAARGAAAGSDRWIVAQSALAELDDFRAQSLSTLTDIDQLAIERAAAGLPDYPALAQAHDIAQADLAAQTARIARLQALMPTG